ncbi:MAG: DNA polymerase III subunit alpha [Firmicutes bacterium]|nr:DNA polymerase III subunit alpha [Bacillota bacterium]
MFAHLHFHSPFSFLDGTGDFAETARIAAETGIGAIALTDHNTVSGALRFQRQLKEAGIKPIIGAEVTLEEGYHLVLLAKDRLGYANLCRLLTEGWLRSANGREFALSLESLRTFNRNLIALSGCRKGKIPALILQNKFQEARQAAEEYLAIFGRENLFLELQGNLLPREARLNKYLADLAAMLKVGVVATCNVHYPRKADFPLHDLLTCVRTLTTLPELHPERRLNAENYLKTPEEMSRLFREYPRALANTALIAEACSSGIDFPRNIFPAFDTPQAESAPEFLRRLTFMGAKERYGRLTPEITARLEQELAIINQLGFADYFLAVWDVVRFARAHKIRYAGRGSAADSAVAYCLYITNVDAIERGLLFERFLSLERGEKPDIDIDFEAEGREKVIEYIYRKYGRERVATVCTFNTFGTRSAIRDLGKAMGFSLAELDRLAKRFPWFRIDDPVAAIQQYPELRNSGLPFHRYEQLLKFVAQVIGQPRFIGTHLGGVVISALPLTDLTPLQYGHQSRLITQFDKHDIEELGLIKFDLLSLKTLSVLRDVAPTCAPETIPQNDRATYEMLNTGETVGVFQLESPAQRNLQSRLGAERMEDLVASVALIRPGPIEGNMVEPYIARRQGSEPISYLHPDLERILKKTYGVVLFQEQVIEIATVIGGFTPGEADQLRRVMTHARSRAQMQNLGALFCQKATARGVSPEVAETIFSYIIGYAGYGFCEAHAAAFADTAYKTAYLLKHYPAEYFCALLNNQPMGFYAPETLCVEARRRGISILPLEINESRREFTVTPAGIRVGFKQLKGITDDTIEAILTARAKAPFTSLFDFVLRVPAANKAITEHLVLAGAFDRLHPNRKQALWLLNQALTAGRTTTCTTNAAPALPLAMPAAALKAPETISDFTQWEKFTQERSVLGFSADHHLLEFYREYLRNNAYATSQDIKELPTDTRVRIAGKVVRPHRPPTKSGRTVVFLTLEDEFGLVDATVFEKTYQSYGHLIFTRELLGFTGRVQRRGKAGSLLVEEAHDLPRTALDNKGPTGSAARRADQLSQYSTR